MKHTSEKMVRQTENGAARQYGAAARAAAAALGCLLVAASVAIAKINPNFTPVHLANQSKLILHLKLSGAEKDGVLTSELVEAMKHEKDKKPAAPSFDLNNTREEVAADFRGRVKANGNGPVLLFSGEYAEEGAAGGGVGEGGLPEGMLHVGGRWYTLARGDGDAWEVLEISDDLQATWAGSSEMLRRVTRYVLTDPNPDVPSVVGAQWGDYQTLGTAAGKVHGVRAIDLKGDGRTYLHVLCEAGDRLFLCTKPKGGGKRNAEDVTAALKLKAKSQAAAWGDFNGDGLLDLASWDGATLSFWFQAEDGTFSVKDSGVKLAECTALAVVSIGERMVAGLLVSGSAAPVLVAPAAGGGFEAKPIAPWAGAELGVVHTCQVADFDGDEIADVLQPFEKGALLYRGVKPGEFRAPDVLRQVGTGKGHADTCVGDYDHDGHFAVFVAAEQGCSLWRNDGKGNFTEALHFSGEIAYISKPDARSCMTCDINNDGRQDIFITYVNILPQIFFNRGFHSYGHAHEVDLQEHEDDLFPRDEDADEEKNEYRIGQQAGAVCDFDGDGAQDMVIVVEHLVRPRVQYPAKPGPWTEAKRNGEILVYWRDSEYAEPLSLRVALPAGGPAGPVRVTGWLGDGDNARCLGAWNVTQGAPGAFFGQLDAGTVKVRWQLPGKEPQETSVDVEDKPERIAITN